MERVRIDPKYQPYVLKHYPHWTLSLNEKQRYLGRAVVWLMRAGEMQRFSDLTLEELTELQLITREYEAVLNDVGWKPDHMNYAMLGNFFHEHGGHGHMHVIPRYSPDTGVRKFMDVEFHDDRWGKDYKPETPMELPEEIPLALAGMLRRKFNERDALHRRAFLDEFYGDGDNCTT